MEIEKSRHSGSRTSQDILLSTLQDIKKSMVILTEQLTVETFTEIARTHFDVIDDVRQIVHDFQKILDNNVTCYLMQQLKNEDYVEIINEFMRQYPRTPISDAVLHNALLNADSTSNPNPLNTMATNNLNLTNCNHPKNQTPIAANNILNENCSYTTNKQLSPLNPNNGNDKKLKKIHHQSMTNGNRSNSSSASSVSLSVLNGKNARRCNGDHDQSGFESNSNSNSNSGSDCEERNDIDGKGDDNINDNDNDNGIDNDIDDDDACSMLSDEMAWRLATDSQELFTDIDNDDHGIRNHKHGLGRLALALAGTGTGTGTGTDNDDILDSHCVTSMTSVRASGVITTSPDSDITPNLRDSRLLSFKSDGMSSLSVNIDYTHTNTNSTNSHIMSRHGLVDRTGSGISDDFEETKDEFFYFDYDTEDNEHYNYHEHYHEHDDAASVQSQSHSQTFTQSQKNEYMLKYGHSNRNSICTTRNNSITSSNNSKTYTTRNKSKLRNVPEKIRIADKEEINVHRFNKSDRTQSKQSKLTSQRRRAVYLNDDDLHRPIGRELTLEDLNGNNLCRYQTNNINDDRNNISSNNSSDAYISPTKDQNKDSNSCSGLALSDENTMSDNEYSDAQTVYTKHSKYNLQEIKLSINSSTNLPRITEEQSFSPFKE